MIGPLPRLHRWILLLVSGLAGAALGAWVSRLAAAQSDYACSEIMLGVCIGTTLNLLPIVAGTTLGLIAALILVYHPHDPHRPVATEKDQRPGGRTLQ